MKKILSAVMGLAMVLGLAFGGGSSASAAGGISDRGVSTDLTKTQYVWGTDTYVQMYVQNTNADKDAQIYVQAERLIDGVWTSMGTDGARMIDAPRNSFFLSNFLMASNGFFKAKGNYRFHYEVGIINPTTGITEWGNTGYGNSSFLIK